MDDVTVFDVIVLGTGLSESIAAAALAKAGLKVAHVDPNPYYGGDEATFTLDELVQWAEARLTSPVEDYRIDYVSPDLPSNPKQYSISLSPSVIPSVGSFISSLISSGVARYGSYKLLGPVGIYRNGTFQSVPQNKESIFQDRSIPLVEKRRLMRFLSFAVGEFETSPELEGKEETPFDRFLTESFGLSEDVSQAITFSLASCDFAGESTSTALGRVRSCLRSSGRYGSSPFLVGYYGGSGEMAQGFCRAAAVSGAVYILGRKISNLVVDEDRGPERFSVELEDVPDVLRSSCILSSLTCLPRCLRSQAHVAPSDLDERGTSQRRVCAVARCIAVVHGTLAPPRLYGTEDVPVVEGQSDSFLVFFPPGSLDGGSPTSSVTLLTAGSGTMSAPSEYNIIYFTIPLQEHVESSKELLQPYLTRILDSNPNCRAVFQLFYRQCFPCDQQPADIMSDVVVLPYLQPSTFQAVDQAAYDAEKVFRAVTRLVDPNGIDRHFWTEEECLR